MNVCVCVLSAGQCVLLVCAKGPSGEFMAALENLKQQLPLSTVPQLKKEQTLTRKDKNSNNDLQEREGKLQACFPSQELLYRDSSMFTRA